MSQIDRKDINEDWAHTGVAKAGDFVFTSYCVGPIGESIENQIAGAFDMLEERLNMFGLTIDSVVKIEALFRDIWDIPVLEKILKERFKEKNYPVRKSIQTEFAHKGGSNGMLFQLDAIAYAGK
ncbi:RidA family protein [Candidatus Enterococcus clewellii]|uniref:Uncharacterized protein n=1 Tax=Candidatus Enterococcus clewellii TaxID=1834193 RepID=A0A242K670_9ENTE|nr:RidA family protein [Enterococcus sp. 9E7_DIV0242]OTP14644.1 hypothetical protein A5888_002745 [Enterococcus sp. 9E7_DIV0242]